MELSRYKSSNYDETRTSGLWIPITKSDSVIYNPRPRGIYIGTAGILVYVNAEPLKLNGTVNVTSGSATISGLGTTFNAATTAEGLVTPTFTGLAVNDVVLIGTQLDNIQERIVTVVTDATTATVGTNFSTTMVGAQIWVLKAATITNISVGEHPLKFAMIRSTTTTASDMVAIY